MSNEEANFEYWKINAYFKILDCVKNGMKNRFSTESLKFGMGVDNFIQLKYGESIELINKYEVTINFKITLKYKTNFNIYLFKFI